MQYSRYNIISYGDENIENINLLFGKRLKIEIIVFHAYCNGNEELLNLYPKIKNKYSEEFLANFEDFRVIGENEVAITLIYKDKYIMEVKCLFPKEYPFRPPQIKINDHEYTPYLSTLQNIKLYDDVKCLCCISLCCRENWGPQNSFIDIIKEIFKNLDIVYIPIENKLYRSIMNKYLGYNIDHDRL